MIILGLMGYAEHKMSHADTGHEGATRIERGSYMDVRIISVTSTTGTAFFAASVKRPDGRCYNNSASTIWVGTVSATAQTNHPNIQNGFPVLSSTTFNLDGSMTDAIYGTSDSGVGTLNVRCIDFLVR